jgi:hypothetical protein
MKTIVLRLAGFVCYILMTVFLPVTRSSAQSNCVLVINCPSNIVVTSCFNVQEFYTPMASNICCGVNSTVFCTPPSGSIFPVGTTTTVNCTATDCAQNTNFCSFTVTVLQGTNCATNYLQVQCPSNIVVTSCTNIQEFYAPTVTDSNCSNWTIVLTPPSGSFFAPNTTNLVDCFVTDYCGESNDCSFTVIVLQGTNCATNCLQVQCPTNKVVPCGSNWVFDLPVASSCCSNFATGSTTPTNLLITAVGTMTNGPCSNLITQTWLITDACGNSTNCSQTVTVVNTNPPFIQCPPNIVVSSCSNVQEFYAPTAIAACGATNVTVVCTPPSGSYFAPGTTTTVNCQATDCSGNTNSCSFTVTVSAQLTVTCPTNKAVFFGSNWMFDLPVASSCCTNYITGSTSLTNILITPVSTVTNGACPLYDVTQTWLITDACGDTNTCSQTVTVRCCVPPPTNMVLWLPFDETHGPISANLASFGNPGTQVNNPAVVLGAYVDNSLNFDGTNQYVTVPDYPAIDIGAGNLTIDAWVLRATNNGNSPPSVIVDKRDVNTGIGYSLSLSYGELILTLSGNNYRDTLGTVPADGQWHFVGVILDQTSTNPKIQFYVDAGPTAAITPTTGNLDNTNSLWVAASPLGGNQPWRGDLDEVEVYDRALANSELADIYNAGVAGKCKPPCPGLTVTCPTNKTVQCGSGWQFDPPVGFTCCSNFVTGSTTPTNLLITPVSTVTRGGCPKIVTRTWVITDGCGDTDTCSQAVTVVDTMPPFIVCPTNAIVVNFNTNCQMVIPLIRPSATDNCTPASQLVYMQTPTNGAIVNGPSQIVTVTVSDLCSNSSQCRVLVVGRYPPPVIICPGVITATNCVMPNVVPLISATGCNDGFPFTFTQSPPPGTPLGPGSVTVTVTVTGLGGSDSCVIAVQYGATMSFLNALTNTGINTNGSLLANTAVDPHYNLGPVPGVVPGYTAPQAVVVTNEWSWLELSPYVSQWIAPCTQVAPTAYLFSCPGGDYTYTNQFVLPVGADASTASISGRWAADNGAAQMEMNGHATGNTIPVPYGFSHWTAFTISSNFLAYPSVNTLLFVVTNQGTSPTGLRVEYTNAFASCTNCAPPSVVWMTSSISLPLGGTAIFTANVSGTLPFTYQWYHNNTPLVAGPHYPGGVNGPTLTITPAGYADAGNYYVLVTNPCGQLKSPVRTLTVTPGWAWAWGWWNFQVTTNYVLATVGPNLILSGTNTMAIGTGTTLDFGLPNAAGGIANVLDVPPLPANTSIQVPLIAAAGSSSDTSYTVMMDIYEPDTSLGTPSTLCESIPCCVSNLSSGGQDGVALTLDAQNNLHTTGSAAGAPFDAGSSVPMPPATWNRVALVVDDPQDGVAVNVSAYLNGQQVASLAVPTPAGLPVNWSNGPPILLSVLSDATVLNGEIYVSSIQFHSVALKPGMIAGMGSPADGPMLADNPAIMTPPVLSVSPQGESGVSLSWSGNEYVLQETTDLSNGQWTDASLPFTESTGTTGNITTTAAVIPSNNVSSKFYRLIFRP